MWQSHDSCKVMWQSHDSCKVMWQPHDSCKVNCQSHDGCEVMWQPLVSFPDYFWPPFYWGGRSSVPVIKGGQKWSGSETREPNDSCEVMWHACGGALHTCATLVACHMTVTWCGYHVTVIWCDCHVTILLNPFHVQGCAMLNAPACDVLW